MNKRGNRASKVVTERPKNQLKLPDHPPHIKRKQRDFVLAQNNIQEPKLPLALINARGNFGSWMLVVTLGRHKLIFKLWCVVERLAAKRSEIAQIRIDVSGSGSLIFL